MITIKKCQEDQLDLLHKIAIQTYNGTYQYLWSDKGKWYLDEFYKKESFKKELSQSDIFYFLVYDADKLIGFFKLKNSSLAAYPAQNCIEIDKLYLLKGSAGKGIGKIVMDFIFSFSKKQDCSVLCLKVMENSMAKYFYEKNGFIQTDKNYLDYPTIKEEYRLILTMVKEI
ncbi:GNAT family N-acetyltransferase [Flavobacterium sp. ANB]|uniref:GNAT family N-acetyltransferase n=1 Tax=unclassified Flavobacterium TaxID=196869 RepID=UPI0012B7D09B|nr:MULTISPECIES: GNAT family N-acetyltransferase [unclassified Flavobacterium]MBF4517848.1 GNAT family N-acetyltransferase [Flavobacterium sp. ANB]